MPGSGVTTRTLSLPQELILMLHNEQTGYFHQVPGWDLNCPVVGAARAELSRLSRIDTDMDSLLPVERTETGDPILDPILREIADEPEPRNAQYWIERLTANAESIIDQTLDRLVEAEILEHHDGDFWTLAESRWHEELFGVSQKGTVGQFIKTRVIKALFTDTIPDPREVIVICLVNTCDVFRFMFEVDDETKERIDFICQMDLIGRSIATAVEHNIASPMLRRSKLTKKRPVVALRRLLLSPHIRSGNIPALFADLTREYGPVFEIRPPFSKPMLFLAGAQINRWVHRHGRMHLKAANYFADFEKIYGEADALFGNGDPDGEDFNQSSTDVTHRFLMECLRTYPIVPMAMRDVMNTFEVEGYEIPVGSRVFIAQTAAHYMDDIFPDPFTFDIDRYRPPRDEHRSPGCAPYGLGTHRCLGSRWMDLQLAVNVLMIARDVTLEVSPAEYVDALRFDPLPSMKPTKKLKFRVVERGHELAA